MPNVLTMHAHITGSINDSPLEGTVDAKIDVRTGMITGELNVAQLPENFVTLASSGLSWLCHTNTGSAKAISPRALNLLELTNFNYDLSRRIEFPDGSAIDMDFEVRRKSEEHVEVFGKWTGSYGLPMNISGIRSPIIEEMPSFSDGRVMSQYEYILYDEDGQEYRVNTPSTYSFNPIFHGLKSIREPQIRTMVFSVETKAPNRQYRVQSQSTMDLASFASLQSSRDHADFGVIVKI